MPETPFIELTEIEKSFGGRKILDGFSLRLIKGDKLALIGESSSGKSTLLKIMTGLIKPDSGQVMVFGQNINRLSSPDLRKIRQRIGMQFQSGALFDSLSVIENLMLARRECAKDAKAKAEAEKRNEPLALLAAVGLANAVNRFPHELSGGMRKRAALARALTTNPDLAVFDEPTAGLDPVTSRRIIDLIGRVSAKSGATMILATTDVQVARFFSSDLIVLNQGRLWARGNVETLKSAEDPFTKQLLSRLL